MSGCGDSHCKHRKRLLASFQQYACPGMGLAAFKK